MTQYICKSILAAAFLMACMTQLHADVLTIGGTINQSTQDGTGPAVNNPSLNNIPDGALFTVDLSFNESITSPGTFDLTGLKLVFNVPAVGAVEDNFDSASLTLTQFGVLDQVSVLACLTTGSGCNQGNELDLNFAVPSGTLTQNNLAIQEIPGLLPFELLEDDGVTDIHGSLTSTSAVPEPSSVVFVAYGLIALALTRQRVKRPL